MKIDAAQYQQIATLVYGGPDGAPTPSEAELVREGRPYERRDVAGFTVFIVADIASER